MTGTEKPLEPYELYSLDKTKGYELRGVFQWKEMWGNIST
jgi:hypothetical protein